MLQTLKRRLVLPALAAAFALVGCERADAPEALVGPELGAPQFSSTSSHKPVEGEDGEGFAGGMLIGPLGGTFDIPGGHKLIVPEGAVSELVLFEATLYPKYLAVDLTATSSLSLTKNDVGSRGFGKPVTLVLSFGKANRLVNTSKAAIAYDNTAAGTLDVLPSATDEKNKSVAAQLSHFSGYIIVD